MVLLNFAPGYGLEGKLILQCLQLQMRRIQSKATNALDQGLANYVPEAKSSLQSVFLWSLGSDSFTFLKVCK